MVLPMQTFELQNNCTDDVSDAIFGYIWRRWKQNRLSLKSNGWSACSRSQTRGH